MPAGISHPEVGYVVFSAVKFAGYTFAAHYLNQKIANQPKSIFFVGATRTAIGMIAGLIVKLLREAAEHFFSDSISGILVLVGYFLFLFPLRLFEWWLLIRVFFHDSSNNLQPLPLLIKLSIWSYILDLPAALGFIFTAGIWIC